MFVYRRAASGGFLRFLGGIVGSSWSKNGFVYLLITLAVIALIYFNFVVPAEELPSVSINKVASYVKAGAVKKISISGDDLTIWMNEGQQPAKLRSRKEPGVSLTETLTSLGVTPEEFAAVEIVPEKPSAWVDIVPMLVNYVPLLGLGLILLLMLRQAQSGNNQALSFGKSRARLFTGDKPTVTFQDVAGVDEAKQELQEVVEFLKEPAKFTMLGARIPKGVLLVGAPGTGKTLLARAVAGEAGVPFFSISGSEFVEMFVGVGASRVRDLFDQAKRNSPCIVFVDEIDAVGRHRGAGLGGSHDEREQTLNQILVEMDGFDTDTQVIVMAATNRPDILDPALLRPGRFDRRVVLDRPDMNGRKAILEVHVRGKPLAEDVDLMELARQTPGFSGADIENLVNEAAILAARRNKKVIGMDEFKEAVERVVAGPERKSRLISAEEKNIVAHHEAGHALVMHHLPKADPVNKVSIVSRGMALGYTIHLPEDDRYLRSKTKFEDEITGLLAGRAAEELVFGDITTGASNDLEQATKLARAMVTQYGMSEVLGPRTFGQKEELIFLGREIAEQRDYSEEVARLIDAEVKRIIETAYQRAMNILKENREKLERLAKRLIEVETIEGPELQALLA
ncbi:MAG: ATP-dependent zinc metalloprotease FtsH [Chloroflexi bacterium]|nr:ATP-dependent zinc metalloprotease FtsH [Chloroflexota bacterium]